MPGESVLGGRGQKQGLGGEAAADGEDGAGCTEAVEAAAACSERTAALEAQVGAAAAAAASARVGRQQTASRGEEWIDERERRCAVRGGGEQRNVDSQGYHRRPTMMACVRQVSVQTVWQNKDFPQQSGRNHLGFRPAGRGAGQPAADGRGGDCGASPLGRVDPPGCRSD